MKPIILVEGTIGVGKTTIAKQMLALRGNAELYSIGQKIKDIVFELDLPYKRDVLQNTGDFFRTYDDLVWINYLMKHINKQKNVGAIIDDIRYSVESEYLKSKGFIIVRAKSEESLRKERISSRDKISFSDENWIDWNTHKNEHDTYSMEADYEIPNNGSIEDLTKEIIKFFNSIEKRSRSLYDFLI